MRVRLRAELVATGDAHILRETEVTCHGINMVNTGRVNTEQCTNELSRKNCCEDFGYEERYLIVLLLSLSLLLLGFLQHPNDLFPVCKNRSSS